MVEGQPRQRPGERGETSTANRNVAVWPASSVATTVTVAVPSSKSSFAATVRIEPATETLTRRASSTVAVQVSPPASPDAAKCAEVDARVSGAQKIRHRNVRRDPRRCREQRQRRAFRHQPIEARPVAAARRRNRRRGEQDANRPVAGNPHRAARHRAGRERQFLRRRFAARDRQRQPQRERRAGVPRHAQFAQSRDALEQARRQRFQPVPIQPQRTQTRRVRQQPRADPAATGAPGSPAPASGSAPC